MKCPKCEAELQMTDKHKIEIDYCPACRGMWLDRSELDKLLARIEVLERGYVVDDRESGSEMVAQYRYGHHGKRRGLFHKMLEY